MRHNELTAYLLEKAAPYIPDSGRNAAASADRPWAKWMAASLGIRDHWYAAEISRNLPEGGHRPVVLLGERILLIRRNGRLYAIEDRCCHRGSPFSVRPIFYTDDTITCWYHTFTFNLDDGRLRCILHDPSSSLAGKVKIKTYPVEEAKGLVFVFVGDGAPPPLAHDCAPGFLDDDVAVCVSDPVVVHANWRLGCETGYDPGHHYIHNWSKYSIDRGIPMTFGWVAENDAIVSATDYRGDANGPRGFTRFAAETTMSNEAVIPGRNGGAATRVVLPLAEGKTDAELRQADEASYDCKVGVWLPCWTKVDPWPTPGIVHYEGCVPRDADSHIYFQCAWKRVRTDEERRAWETDQGRREWEIPVVEEFTTEDVEGREAIHRFYAEEGGWANEILERPDIEILMWRIFASEYSRGPVQTEAHARGGFKR